MLATNWVTLTALFAMLFGAAPATAQCVGVTPAAAAAVGNRLDPCTTATGVPEGKGTAYNVGPSQPFENIGDVPWYKLGPGDTVFIHHRDRPYREKILISGRGTLDQWIRVLGVPGPNGQLPIISGDGAVTSKNMRYRWQDPQVVQRFGVIQIAINSGVDGGASRLPPGYIEIANLQVQDGFSAYRFTAENGASVTYDGFAACIYARSVQHLVVRNNVLTNCGQGFYNWTGDGSGPEWWSALQTNTVIIGNHIYNNGNPRSYFEHQVYTESDRVRIEYNRFGPQRPGSLGSQIKDRSVGTIVRFNTIEQSPAGWDIDLVEPENSWNSVGHKEEYKQTFIYGNVIRSKGVKSPNIIHWNEDHQANKGRATLTGAKLHSIKIPWSLFQSGLMLHHIRSSMRRGAAMSVLRLILPARSTCATTSLRFCRRYQVRASHRSDLATAAKRKSRLVSTGCRPARSTKVRFLVLRRSSHIQTTILASWVVMTSD